MRAPKCKTCGKEHYGLCGPAPTEARTVSATDPRDKLIADLRARIAELEAAAQPKPKSKSRAEYMRAYRARANG